MSHLDDICYIPATFCSTSLPHRRVRDQEYERKNGACHLHMLSPKRTGLPFGTFARLLLIYATTQAVIKNTRHISLGNCMGHFLKALKIANTGRHMRSIYDQLLRLRLVALQVTWQIEDAKKYQEKSFATIPFSDFAGWRHKDGSKSQAIIVFSEDLFNRLSKGEAVPLSMRTVQSLRQSSLALDIYCWLTYRMYDLKQDIAISWPSLRQQFGAQYANTKQGRFSFKQEFCNQMRRVLNQYPDAKVKLTYAGIVLSPSPTHVPCKHLNRSWISLVDN